MILASFLPGLASSWAGLLVAQDPPAPPQSGTVMFLMIGSMALLFWAIILRPQRAEQKKREEMLNAVAKGDHVVTAGGIHGTVEGVDISEGVVILTVAPKVSIRVSKSSVSTIRPKGQGKNAAKEQPEEASAGNGAKAK